MPGGLNEGGVDPHVRRISQRKLTMHGQVAFVEQLPPRALHARSTLPQLPAILILHHVDLFVLGASLP
jgi:hypothetical protein